MLSEIQLNFFIKFLKLIYIYQLFIHLTLGFLYILLVRLLQTVVQQHTIFHLYILRPKYKVLHRLTFGPVGRDFPSDQLSHCWGYFTRSGVFRDRLGFGGFLAENWCFFKTTGFFYFKRAKS